MKQLSKFINQNEVIVINNGEIIQVRNQKYKFNNKKTHATYTICFTSVHLCTIIQNAVLFSVIIQISRQDLKVCCIVYSHFTQHSPSTCTGFVQFRGTGGHGIRSHDACVPGSASSGQSQNTQGSMNTLSPRGSVSPMLGPKMISHPSSSSSAYDAPIITRDRAKNTTTFILCCKEDFKQFT